MSKPHQSAMNLLLTIVQHQPNLLQPKQLNAQNGKEVAEFLIELYKGLINLYQAQNQGEG